MLSENSTPKLHSRVSGGLGFSSCGISDIGVGRDINSVACFYGVCTDWRIERRHPSLNFVCKFEEKMKNPWWILSSSSHGNSHQQFELHILFFLITMAGYI